MDERNIFNKKEASLFIVVSLIGIIKILFSDQLFQIAWISWISWISYNVIGTLFIGIVLWMTCKLIVWEINGSTKKEVFSKKE